MPTQDWLKKEFGYGYDSGNVLSIFPSSVRRKEERAIGGSYRKVFRQGLLPFLKPNSKILEIGPGRGSWSKAILQHIPQGELHVVDFQNVESWLQPSRYPGRLYCHQIEDSSAYDRIFDDDYFDVCWSFGVLCHNNLDKIEDVLTQTIPKVKENGYAIHHYGDWEKLENYGWEKGGVPLEFRDKQDDEIWWPRNAQSQMTAAAQRAGWKVINADLGLVQRDSIAVLQRCN
ncbi:class I SAM-dependent methyltransferase [Nodosilinea nodulosa]|uniref:class I SAM-dependent methyltransferase n=1 Tax=Nodosilinea nodulosa TaxID=416001 RepID=UPI000474CE8C|nr:class I SAM-dependent methyltransferase [Nodosilinea nodulosa]